MALIEAGGEVLILKRAGITMKILAIVLIAIVAAWHGASWKAAMLTEEEEQAISVGLKTIANTLRRRSCIFQAEIKWPKPNQ
jgi:hypothetical protein